MILIIDNYDSFTYNLVHLVGAETDDLRVVRNDELTVEDVRDLAPEGILISPGPGRPADAGITEPLIRELGPTTPIFGVCLGMQAIGEVYGGRVVHAPQLMHGKTSRVRHDGAGVFEGVEPDFVATRYHSLVVDRATLPAPLAVTAESAEAARGEGVVMGLRHREHPVCGVQFHPESVLTTEGPRIVRNWVRAALARGVRGTRYEVRYRERLQRFEDIQAWQLGRELTRRSTRSHGPGISPATSGSEIRSSVPRFHHLQHCRRLRATQPR